MTAPSFDILDRARAMAATTSDKELMDAILAALLALAVRSELTPRAFLLVVEGNLPADEDWPERKRQLLDEP